MNILTEVNECLKDLRFRIGVVQLIYVASKFGRFSCFVFSDPHRLIRLDKKKNLTKSEWFQILVNAPEGDKNSLYRYWSDLFNVSWA